MSPWGSGQSANYDDWQEWFAWHPVIVDGNDLKELIWWEPVMRRRSWHASSGYSAWQYKAID